MVGYRGDSASKNVVNGDMYNESVRSLLPGLSQLIGREKMEFNVFFVECFILGGLEREGREKERERESERYR